jgi:hypothetical protein
MPRLMWLVLLLLCAPIFFLFMLKLDKITWNSDMLRTCLALVIGLLTIRRYPMMGAIFIIYATVGVWAAIDHLPPDHDSYKTVPPSNTLVIPQKR